MRHTRLRRLVQTAIPALLALALAAILPPAGCMHITMDVNANVNVNVKLDKALNDYFNDLDKNSATMQSTVTPAAETSSSSSSTTPAIASATPAATGATGAYSTQDTELRARVKQRQPQIDKLKETGALGENNQGYLEVRDNQDGAAALAAAANADRKTIYQNIAAKQKVTPEEVGKARAQQIAQKSLPGSGVWLQDPQGVWAKK